MQNTILEMTKRSVKRYVDAINWFLPISTTVNSSCEVENIYYSEEETRAMGASKEKFPLFSIDIDLNDNTVCYSSDPINVTMIIQKIFDSGLEALKEIPLLE
jgi:hypothetical protein